MSSVALIAVLLSLPILQFVAESSGMPRVAATCKTQYNGIPRFEAYS
jgi:hypothetical protein